MALPRKKERRVRIYLFLLILGLIMSGASTFDVPFSLGLVEGFFASLPFPASYGETISLWKEGIMDSFDKNPYLPFFTDWLGFGHFAIAIVFFWPYHRPLRYRWVMKYGLSICVLVVPFALILGFIRDIPFFWLVFDIMFAVVGGTLLYLCLRETKDVVPIDQG